MNRTLLVDADIVAYKFAAAHEEVYYFDGRDQPPAVSADLQAALTSTEEYIAELQARLGATEVVVCLTDPERNFRKEIVWDGYKGNRVGLRKPEHLTAVKDWFKTRYQTYQRPALEADDCMGILSTHPSLIRGEKIIVSEDKDMASIPGLLFNPAKDEAPRRITKIAADRFHMWQTIVGDSSDGYPGAPGVGPKSPEAESILSARTVEEAWQHVLCAFRRSKATAGKTEEEIVRMAVTQARLARILRSSDWNFRAKKPVLWVPPRATH